MVQRAEASMEHGESERPTKPVEPKYKQQRGKREHRFGEQLPGESRETLGRA